MPAFASGGDCRSRRIEKVPDEDVQKGFVRTVCTAGHGEGDRRGDRLRYLAFPLPMTWRSVIYGRDGQAFRIFRSRLCFRELHHQASKQQD
jgi:hypothetical protein